MGWSERIGLEKIRLTKANNQIGATAGWAGKVNGLF